MLENIYSLPFKILNTPNLRVKRPSWLNKPPPMVVFSFILLSYFLVCGGVIYDVIVEPPSIGSTVDEHGHSRPVAFLPYRVNGQYIMEGLAASFMFCIGSIGFIIMDRLHNPSIQKLNRTVLTLLGFCLMIIPFCLTWIFMRMKLPSYLM